MALTKATHVYAKRTGFWIFAGWRVYVGKRDWYSFRAPEFDRLRAGNDPVCVAREGRRTLWMVDDDFYWDTDNLTAEEVGLLIWDRSRRHEAKLARLRKLQVQATEIAASRRERIPDDVRAFVWERDEGRCVSCGSEESLQFDHVIPVAKGGGSGAANIQLLCADCNGQKGDAIV